MKSHHLNFKGFFNFAAFKEHKTSLSPENTTEAKSSSETINAIIQCLGTLKNSDGIKLFDAAGLQKFRDYLNQLRIFTVEDDSMKLARLLENFLNLLKNASQDVSKKSLIAPIIQELFLQLSEAYQPSYHSTYIYFAAACEKLTGYLKSRFTSSLFDAIKNRVKQFLGPHTETPHRTTNLIKYFYQENEIPLLNTTDTITVELQESMFDHRGPIYFHHDMLSLTHREAKYFVQQKNTPAIVEETLLQFMHTHQEKLDNILEESAKIFLMELWWGLKGKPLKEAPLQDQELQALLPLVFAKDPSGTTVSLNKKMAYRHLFFAMIDYGQINKDVFVQIQLEGTTFNIHPALGVSWAETKSETDSRSFFPDHFKTMTIDQQRAFLKQLVLLPPEKMHPLAISGILIDCLKWMAPAQMPTLDELGINEAECRRTMQLELVIRFALKNEDMIAKQVLAEKLNLEEDGEMLDFAALSSTDILKLLVQKNIPTVHLIENEFLRDINWTKDLLLDCYALGIRNFSGIVLKDIDLSFHGNGSRIVDLSEANFSHATFQNVTFNRKTKIYDIQLYGATIDQTSFHGLYQAGKRNFNSTKLTGIDLFPFSGKSLSFEGANLKNAKLANTNIADFCLYGADLTGADLTNANATHFFSKPSVFYHTNLNGATLTNLRAVDSLFSAALDFKALDQFIGTTREKDLRYVTFIAETDEEKEAFQTFDFRGAHLAGHQIRKLIAFGRTDFQNLDLSGAKIVADVKSTGDAKPTSPAPLSLAGVDFKGSNLADTNFAGTELKGAQFKGARINTPSIFDKKAEHLPSFANTRYQTLFGPPVAVAQRKAKYYDYLVTCQGKNHKETLRNLLNIVYLKNTDTLEYSSTRRAFERARSFSWRSYVAEVEELLKKKFDDFATIADIEKQLPKTVRDNFIPGGELYDIFAFCKELEKSDTEQKPSPAP